MKKQYFIMIIVFILLLVFIFKDCTGINEGTSGVSISLSQSKYFGVFIAEYRPESNNIIINENILIKTNEIWLEKAWSYSNNLQNPRIDSANKYPIRLYISTRNYSLKEHLNTWWLDNFYNLTPGDETGGSIIYREMRWSEIKDTLEFRIIKLNDTSHLFENDSIGVIRFFRVK